MWALEYNYREQVIFIHLQEGPIRRTNGTGSGKFLTLKSETLRIITQKRHCASLLISWC